MFLCKDVTRRFYLEKKKARAEEGRSIGTTSACNQLIRIRGYRVRKIGAEKILFRNNGRIRKLGTRSKEGYIQVSGEIPTGE